MTAKTRAKNLPRSVVASLLVFAIMTIILAEMSERINYGPLTVADVRLSNWLHENRSQPLTLVMRAITTLGDTWAVTFISISFLVFLLWRRRFNWAGIMSLSVFGGMLLNRFLKLAFLRPRPSFDEPLLTFTGYSFPSGHTMAATVLYGTFAVYFFTRTTGTRRRALIIFIAGLLIVLVAFSRIYLGAHYLSDVLAAIAEGLAWLSLCLTLRYYHKPPGKAVQ